MKRIVAIMFIFVLSLSSVSPFVVGASANTTLTHQQMVEKYGQGYADAMFSTVLEAQSKMAINEANNRSALDGFIDTSKDYVRNRAKAYNDAIVQNNGNLAEAYFGTATGLLKEVGIGVFTLGDTAIDFLKSLFSSESHQPPTNSCITSNANQYYPWDLAIGCGYKIKMKINGIEYVGSGAFNSSSDPYRKIHLYNDNGSNKELWNLNNEPYVYPTNISTLNSVLRKFSTPDRKAWIEFNGVPIYTEPEEIELNQYINNRTNTPERINIPILKPEATCSNGIVPITPDGQGGFLDSSGNPINVSNCTVVWKTPIIERDPEGNLTIDDGETKKDLVEKVPEPEPEVECDGVLCFLSKIVGSIADIVTTLLDGLVSLFVPDDLSFITQDFEKMKTKILIKVEIITQLQDVMTGIFDTEASPALTATIEMPAMDKPVKLLDLDIIQIGLPIFKKVMSGVLILFTLFYVYRKITGDGGLMEK